MLVRFRHRAATTGSVGFIRLLIESSTPLNKLRLNTADRIGKVTSFFVDPPVAHLSVLLNKFVSSPSGNTPLHLAMDSAHAEVAVLLINAGADRTRVRIHQIYPQLTLISSLLFLQENLDAEIPENVPGVGGQEQKLARQHVVDHCGKPLA